MGEKMQSISVSEAGAEFSPSPRVPLASPRILMHSSSSVNMDLVALLNRNDNVAQDVLYSFVPDTLLTTLKGYKPSALASMQPSATSTKGVCLIADISGFTRISSSLCSQGMRGIDGLQKLINGYLGGLVSIIYEHGGDIMKFAGDALICLFVPSSNSDTDALLACKMAMLCAWKLKDQCTEQLNLHVAAGWGDISLAILGGHDDKWEFLQACDCMELLSVCLDAAPPKSIVTTSVLYQRIRSLCQQLDDSFEISGREVVSGFLIQQVDGNCSIVVSQRIINQSKTASSQRLRDMDIDNKTREPLPNQLAITVAKFVPDPVTQALGADLIHFLAELREVTTVFIKWETYNWQQYKDLLLLQPFLKTAQELISVSGGFLRQFLIDDKGCVLIVVWGVPAATFPDNCMRALWMSTTLHQKFVSMGMNISCGITTGTVYCGNVGSSARQEYTAIGSVVNLSARLMSKANRTIFVDEETFYRLPESMHSKLKDVGGVRVKGVEEVLKVYRFVDYPVNFDFRDIIFSLTPSPIRRACKAAFIPLLRQLLVQSERHIESVSHRKTKSWFGHFGICRGNQKDVLGLETQLLGTVSPQLSVKTGEVGEIETRKVFIVLVQGAVGMGKGKAMSWLRSSAAQIHAEQVNIVMQKHEISEEYAGIQKLFRQLVSDAIWDNLDARGEFVHNLVRQLYPTDKEMRNKVALTVFATVFRAHAPVQEGGRSLSLVVGDPFKVNIAPAMKLRCILDVFRMLLQTRSVLAILENVQNLDQTSWKIFKEIAQLDVNLGIVMTQLITAAGTANKSDKSRTEEGPRRFSSNLGMSTKITQPANVEFFKTGTAAWLESCIEDLLTNPRCTKVILAPCSTEEIVDNLAFSLVMRPNSLPPGLATAVQQLSGSNPMWVSEICEFIKSNGVEEFMNSMGNTVEGDDDGMLVSGRIAMSTGTPEVKSRRMSLSRGDSSGSLFGRQTGGESSHGRSSFVSNSGQGDDESTPGPGMRLSRQSSFKASLLNASPSRRVATDNEFSAINSEGAASGNGRRGSNAGLSHVVESEKTVLRRRSLTNEASPNIRRYMTESSIEANTPATDSNRSSKPFELPFENFLRSKAEAVPTTQYQEHPSFESALMSIKPPPSTTAPPVLSPRRSGSDSARGADESGRKSSGTGQLTPAENLDATSTNRPTTEPAIGPPVVQFSPAPFTRSASGKAKLGRLTPLSVGEKESGSESFGPGPRLNKGSRQSSFSAQYQSQLQAESNGNTGSDLLPLNFAPLSRQSSISSVNGSRDVVGELPTYNNKFSSHSHRVPNLNQVGRLSNTDSQSPGAVSLAPSTAETNSRSIADSLDFGRQLTSDTTLTSDSLSPHSLSIQTGNTIATSTSGTENIAGIFSEDARALAQVSTPKSVTRTFSEDLRVMGSRRNSQVACADPDGDTVGNNSPSGGFLRSLSTSVAGAIQRVSFTSGSPLVNDRDRQNLERIPQERSMSISIVGDRSSIRTSTKELKPSATNKLAFLVVTRFAKLNSESQSVARTAAIVGLDFTLDLLSEVIPKVLRPQLPAILEGLVTANWLDPSSIISNSDGTSYIIYNFTHPRVHKTIYDLTPGSIRESVHLQLAEFLEKSQAVFNRRDDYLQILAYHYLRCADKRDKKFEYLTKVAMESTHGYTPDDFENALAFTQYAAEYAVEVIDFTCLIGITNRLRARHLARQRSLNKINPPNGGSSFRISTSSSPRISQTSAADSAATIYLRKLDITEANLVISERQMTALATQPPFDINQLPKEQIWRSVMIAWRRNAAELDKDHETISAKEGSSKAGVAPTSACMIM